MGVRGAWKGGVGGVVVRWCEARWCGGAGWAWWAAMGGGGAQPCAHPKPTTEILLILASAAHSQHTSFARNPEATPPTPPELCTPCRRPPLHPCLLSACPARAHHVRPLCAVRALVVVRPALAPRRAARRPRPARRVVLAPPAPCALSRPRLLRLGPRERDHQPGYVAAVAWLSQSWAAALCAARPAAQPGPRRRPACPR